METPKNDKFRRSSRNPTPRLSERKKSLFSSKEEAQEDLMNGIKPLEPGCKRSDLRTSKSRRRIVPFLPCSDDQSSKNESDDNINESPSPSQKISMRLSTNNNVSPVRRSPRQAKSANSPAGHKAKTFKENIPVNVEAEEQLQQLFNSSMMLCAEKETFSFNETLKSSNDTGISCDDVRESSKRQNDSSSSSGSNSPQKKVQRLENKLTFPPTSISISTKSFYSNSKPSPPTKMSTPSAKQLNTSPQMRKPNRPKACQINKGVSHKIRRRPKQLGFNSRSTHSSIDVDLILNNVRNEKLRNLITNKRQEKIQIESVHKILRNTQNSIELARPLNSMSCYANANTNNSNAHENIKDRNETSSVDNDFDFSDMESDSEDGDLLGPNQLVERVIPSITHQQTDPTLSPSKTVDCPSNINKNRKFFKSDRSTSSRKEVKITDNIKASVFNGKISLVEHKKPARKKIKLKNAPVNEFSAEQATVDAILKNLDDTTFGDLTATRDLEQIYDTEDSTLAIDENSTNELELYDDTDYSIFRSRLPYNTTNPDMIEQQHLLLDFLINNNICTEDNFTIFIADPDNHKEEAAQIVDQVIVVVNEQSDFRDRIPYNTSNPEIIKQQQHNLDFLIKNNICTEENFDIFIANYENRFEEAENIVQNVLLQNTYETDKKSSPNSLISNLKIPAVDFIDTQMEVEIGNQNKVYAAYVDPRQTAAAEEELMPKSENLFPIFYAGKCQPLPQKSSRKFPRNWNGGHGVNQYQIDAGQKKFGAQQCKQCGLVYTVHEPEEEKLHRDFHSSLYVLRFKGWIDEDIVAIYPEWGADGRIIRISDASHVKRRERLMDVLKIVDKELGFSQYIFPKSYVAYFAVRKNQIVGLCLVQPLQKAYKYMCVNGVDCCTTDEYEAKCGVSRLWVSPLHRRMHIASKLLQAVQFNTIFGEEISLEKIAFSAPTENGKQFAQKVTKMENFLVYQ